MIARIGNFPKNYSMTTFRPGNLAASAARSARAPASPMALPPTTTVSMVSGGALPTCLARPWAAAWALYVAHAASRNYAAHLVPRPCAEKLSGDCLPAACAD